MLFSIRSNFHRICNIPHFLLRLYLIRSSCYNYVISQQGKSIFEIEPDINEIKKVDTYLRKTIMDYCLKIHSLSISTWEELDNAYRVHQNFLKL